MSVMLRRKNALRNAGRFLSEVWGELKKVQWPTWPELYGFTVMVIVAIVAMGLYIAVLDKGLTWASNHVFKLGGS